MTPIITRLALRKIRCPQKTSPRKNPHPLKFPFSTPNGPHNDKISPPTPKDIKLNSSIPPCLNSPQQGRIRTRSQSLSRTPSNPPDQILLGGIGLKNSRSPSKSQSGDSPVPPDNKNSSPPEKHKKKVGTSPEKIIRATSRGGQFNSSRTPIFSFYHRPGGMITRSQMKTYYTHPSSQGYWLTGKLSYHGSLLCPGTSVVLIFVLQVRLKVMVKWLTLILTFSLLVGSLVRTKEKVS